MTDPAELLRDWTVSELFQAALGANVVFRRFGADWKYKIPNVCEEARLFLKALVHELLQAKHRDGLTALAEEFLGDDEVCEAPGVGEKAVVVPSPDECFERARRCWENVAQPGPHRTAELADN